MSGTVRDAPGADSDADSGNATTASMPRRRRRWLRITIWTAVIVVVLVVGGTAGTAWYFSGLGIEPNHTPYPPSEIALGVGNANGGPTVMLTASNATRRPGVYGLSWQGGAAMIGDVVSQSPDRVERMLLSGAAPPTGTRVGMDWNYPADPRSLLGLDFSEISVPTELGPAPAWYFPATGAAGSTWVIAVHGQNGRPNSTMPSVPTMHRLGLPVLSITYRNDLAAPASPDGLMHLGESEWRDVEAAIRTAQSMGARRVVLAGFSMGGATVGQVLVHSPLANIVTAVVVDAPEFNWRRVCDFQSGQRYAPAPLSWVVQRTIEWRTGMDLGQLDLINHPPATKPPMLLYHGTADTEVPVQASRDFAAAAGRLHWSIQYEEFPDAGHTQSWNVDHTRYERVLADFLTRTVLDPG